jgi:cellulose synthase/poly-beta-1,6-N-acetylglucosamine synthase-like glycosyltransferase
VRDYPFVSVVIPVYNDPGRLPKCLAALEEQGYPSDRYEVIAVDNGSDTSIESLAKAFPHVRTALEMTPGSYAARNRGIALASGPVIAFTDSDTLPCPDWIEKGVEALYATPNCGLVGGRISHFVKDPARPTAVELYDLVCALPQKEFINTYGFAATANIFTFREILEKVGAFNPVLKSSGDREWCDRVVDAGYSLKYAEEACVEHPARYDFGEAYSRTRRLVSGWRDLAHLKGARISFRRQAIGILLDLVPPVPGLCRRCLSPRLNGPVQRLKVAMVTILIRYAQAWVRIRLLFSPLGQIR